MTKLLLLISFFASLNASSQYHGFYVSGDTLRYITSGNDTIQINRLPRIWGTFIGALSDQTDLQAALDAKQSALVSATNIKTVGGVSLLGSGNIPTGAMTRVFLPNDVINNNAIANTIADVTGLSFPVVANTTYQFRFVIVYSSAATTTGSRWSINGPATTHMSYTSQYPTTATAITNNPSLAGYNLPSASNASSLTTNNRCIIQGEIRPSADGTVIARFASEILSSAITAVASGRSYVEYQIIN